MTVADLLAILRDVDPSRQVVVSNPWRGRGKCWCAPRTAAERTLTERDRIYYPLASPADVQKAVVFLLEG